MRRIFAIFVSTVCLSFYCEADAQNKTSNQDATYLVSNPQTARWSYIETDSHGKMTATIFNSVESIAGDAVNGNIKMLVEEVPVASPKDTVRSYVYYRFKDGEFMVDVSAGIEYNIFEDKLDSIVCNTINEKYPEYLDSPYELEFANAWKVNAKEQEQRIEVAETDPEEMNPESEKTPEETPEEDPKKKEEEKPIIVIPTDEEYMIACDTEALAKAL